MNKTQLFSMIAGIAVASSALAGGGKNPGKNVIAPSTPSEQGGIFGSLEGSVSVGYDTQYIYRGVEVGDHLVWGAIDLNIPFSESLKLNINTWYGALADTPSDYGELDVYTALRYKVNDMVTFGPSYKWYHYTQAEDGALDNQHEIGLEATITPVENLGVYVGAFYEFEVEGFYYELGLSYTAAINDNVSLIPYTKVSYSDDSTVADSSEFNHVAVGLNVPIKLTAKATLTPFIEVNIPLDNLDANQDEEVHGGAAISVSF
jgi:hypothetical protein